MTTPAERAIAEGRFTVTSFTLFEGMLAKLAPNALGVSMLRLIGDLPSTDHLPCERRTLHERIDRGLAFMTKASALFTASADALDATQNEDDKVAIAQRGVSDLTEAMDANGGAYETFQDLSAASEFVDQMMVHAAFLFASDDEKNVLTLASTVIQARREENIHRPDEHAAPTGPLPAMPTSVS